MIKKLSVIIITYNQEKYIAKTLDSIINQEHDYSYEIVIGEDNSTDNTKKIIEQYVSKYSGIIKPIYNKKNFGLLKNYYNTLSNSTGEYIMCCGGDDYWLPGKIKTQIDFMENNKDVGLSYGIAKGIDENDTFLNLNYGKQCEELEQLLKENNIPAVTVCYRKKLIDEYIKEIDPLSKDWKMEDYPTWLWFSKNSVIKFIKEEFACYRILQNSISRPISIDKQFQYASSVQKVKSFFSEYYKVNTNIISDKELMYSICFSSLLNNYSKDIAIKLTEFENKDLKGKLKKIIILNPCLFAIVKKIKWGKK